jgi:hypothetical protein
MKKRSWEKFIFANSCHVLILEQCQAGEISLGYHRPIHSRFFFDLRIFHFYSVIGPILKFIIKNLHLLYNSIIIVLHKLLKSAAFINFSNTVKIIFILGSNP